MKQMQRFKSQKIRKMITGMLTILLAFLVMMPVGLTAYASQTQASTEGGIEGEDAGGVKTNWDIVYGPLLTTVDDMAVPFMEIIVAVGSLYCVFLGVKFAKAEDPQEHEKAKKAIINAAIGFVTIFVLLFVLHKFMPIFAQWLYVAMRVGRD